MTLKILKTEKDPDLFYYAKEIEINKKKFKTPFSLMHKSIDSSNLSYLPNPNMYEIWKSFKTNELANVLTDIKEQQKFNNQIKTGIDNRTRNYNKIYFLSIANFSSNPLKFFDDRLIEFLIDSTYLYTEIITFPIIRRLMDYINNEKMKDELIEFIKKCCVIAETLNNKPIMAIIPPLPVNYIPPVVKTYLELGIDFFCFNFEGSSLSGYYQNYCNLLRTLYRHDQKTYGEKIKYVINLILPKNRFRYQPFPATDMMTPALSTDIIGLNHIVGGSSSGKKKTGTSKEGKKKREIIRTNLLDIDSYTYQRIKDMNDFNENFENPIIKPSFKEFNLVKPVDRYDFMRGFNFVNSNLEMSSIHKEIMSNNPIEKYLYSKVGVKEDLNSKSSLLDLNLNTKGFNEFFT